MDRRGFMQAGVGAVGLTLAAQGANGQDATENKSTLRIRLYGIPVDDQEKALKFYTEVLGFVKKQEIPMGPVRYLTVVSPLEPDGTELSLEPAGFPAVKTFQKALQDMGVPWTAFEVADIQKEYDRLTALNVAFKGKPFKMGPVIQCVFDDTCGNLMMLYQAA